MHYHNEGLVPIEHRSAKMTRPPQQPNNELNTATRQYVKTRLNYTPMNKFVNKFLGDRKINLQKVITLIPGEE